MSDAVQLVDISKSKRGTAVMGVVELKDSTTEAGHHKFRFQTRGNFSFAAESKVVDGKLVVTFGWGNVVRPVDAKELKAIENEVYAKVAEALSAIDVKIA